MRGTGRGGGSASIARGGGGAFIARGGGGASTLQKEENRMAASCLGVSK